MWSHFREGLEGGGVGVAPAAKRIVVRPFLANQSDRRADVQFNDGVAEFLASEIDVATCIHSLSDRRRLVRSLRDIQ